MKEINSVFSLKSAISLEPLLAFWEENLVTECRHMHSMYTEIKEKISQRPVLQGTIEDPCQLEEHHDVLKPLMSAIFPPASFNSEIAGAMVPCTFRPFFVTPQFQSLFIDRNQFLESIKKDQEFETAGRLLKTYMLILERIYGMDYLELDKTRVKGLKDEVTGLDRYYRFIPDFRFVQVHPLTPPPELSDDDCEIIAEHITDVEVLGRYITLDNFEFTGFMVVRADDITNTEVMSKLERDLIDRHTIFSADGIKHLESRLQVLFQRPDLALGIGAVNDDQIMVIKNDCQSNINCLFSNSKHIRLEEIEDTIWMKATQQPKVQRIPDLKEKKDLHPMEAVAVAANIRSMLLAPLSYQGEFIGMLARVS